MKDTCSGSPRCQGRSTDSWFCSVHFDKCNAFDLREGRSWKKTAGKHSSECKSQRKINKQHRRCCLLNLEKFQYDVKVNEDSLTKDVTPLQNYFPRKLMCLISCFFES